jgi:DNA-binding GntR family transcriptional regulator
VSWDVVADHDIAFHRAMFAAAGSPRLLQTFNGVAAELRLLIAQLQGGQLGPVLQAWHEHLDIAEHFFLDLIRERDR